MLRRIFSLTNFWLVIMTLVWAGCCIYIFGLEEGKEIEQTFYCLLGGVVINMITMPILMPLTLGFIKLMKNLPRILGQKPRR